MVVVVRNLNTLVGEVINYSNRGVKPQCWQLKRHTINLLAGLIEMVEIEVTIPSCPNEFARLEVAHLSHHAG